MELVKDFLMRDRPGDARHRGGEHEQPDELVIDGGKT